jgi:predicted DNA-binding transcriptional regulator AlpA
MNSLNCSTSHSAIEAAPGAEAPQHSAHAGEIVLGGRVYLTTESLAAKLGKSPRTIARWTSVGTGPPRIRIGKLILFDVIKVQQWLEAFEAEPVRVPLRRRVR